MRYNMNKLEKAQQQIEHARLVDRQRKAHHAALRKLAVKSIKDDGLRLWRKLRRVEVRTRGATIRDCNDGLSDREKRDIEAAAHRQVEMILGRIPPGFFVNWDARGCALKIDGENAVIPDGMWRDMGGFGLLAPEIR